MYIYIRHRALARERERLLFWSSPQPKIHRSFLIPNRPGLGSRAGLQAWMPGFLVVSKGRSTNSPCSPPFPCILFSVVFERIYQWAFFPENVPLDVQNGAQMGPEWWPEPGFYDSPGTLFPCNTTSFLLDLLLFRVPDQPQEPLFLLFCYGPPKKHIFKFFLWFVHLCGSRYGGE